MWFYLAVSDEEDDDDLDEGGVGLEAVYKDVDVSESWNWSYYQKQFFFTVFNCIIFDSVFV